MEFRHLEVFVAVADTRNFSKAAEQLKLTQPTISSHIHSLEKELDLCLFHRTTKSIQITPEGEAFLSYARRILELKASALNNIDDHSKTIIHVGASTIPSTCLLPEIAAGYHKIAPQVYLDILRADSEDVEDRILDGSLDVGLIGYKTERPHCTYHAFASKKLVIAMPATNYYREILSSANPMEQLLKEPLILREQGSATAREAKRLFEKQGVTVDSLNVIANHSDPESIKQMVIAGMGIAIFSGFVTQSAAKRGELLEYVLSESTEQQFYTVRLNYRNLSPAVTDFIDYVNRFLD